MGRNRMNHAGWMGRGGGVGVLVAVLAGCASAPPDAAPGTAPHVAGPQAGQQTFASPDAALAALVAAATAQDHDAMHRLFGPALHELVSGDRVEDANAYKKFAQHAAERTRVETKSDSMATVYIGNDDWPFPIPLEKAGGVWFFDTEAGKAEILARRIGANELATIQVCRAYVEAQREYASQDRDGSEVLQYAQRFVSTPGHKDGLYWKAAPGAGEEQSPFGPLVAQAALEGYAEDQAIGAQPFHGYYFRILSRQGAAPPAGRYDYVINGRMIAGFALVACPARYGASGVMTFVVSHQGKVCEKDLGPDTQRIVRGMREYNPDATWRVVKE